MENVCQLSVMTRQYLIGNSNTPQAPPSPKSQISLVHYLDFIKRQLSDSPSYGIKWHLINQHRKRMRNEKSVYATNGVVKPASYGCI